METANGIRGRKRQKRESHPLTAELQETIKNAEELLETAASQITEETRLVRERLQTALSAARDAYQLLSQHVVAGAAATDRMIRRRPYPFLGGALGLGFVVGILLKRK